MDEFKQLYKKFKDLGGILEIEIYQTTAAYNLHFVNAKRFLEDRDVIDIDWIEFQQSKKILSPEQFFGIYFDFDTLKPLIRGKSEKFANSYFRYDQTERTDNINSDLIELNAKKYQETGPGYSYAFLEPPFATNFGETVQEIGEFFLEFSNCLFSNFEELDIYQWPTSSTYFDAGNEWWGSFMWTIYNPTKKWTIVICASQTD